MFTFHDDGYTADKLFAKWICFYLTFMDNDKFINYGLNASRWNKYVDENSRCLASVS